MKNKTIWSNRFKNKMSLSFQKIGSSIHIDKRLYEQDIAASIVHTQMLTKQKIIDHSFHVPGGRMVFPLESLH